jgi:hypothetical protein
VSGGFDLAPGPCSFIGTAPPPERPPHSAIRPTCAMASRRRPVVSCAPPTGSSARRTHRAEVAQSVEHATENRGVASSILALGTIQRVVEHRAEVAQLVEHHLAKVRVAGSSPVFRSTILPEGPAAPSSSGRTADFGSVNRGSNPRGAASIAPMRGAPRRGDVVKWFNTGVCKTPIHRFESGRRLHNPRTNRGNVRPL